MLIQTLDDVAVQTYYRLVNLLNTAAIEIGPLNRAKASLYASQFGLSLKDFFHNRLREYKLPDDFSISKGMTAATYAFSAGIGKYYEVKRERFSRDIHFYYLNDRLAKITIAFVNAWIKHIQ